MGSITVFLTEATNPATAAAVARLPTKIPDTNFSLNPPRLLVVASIM